MHRAYCIYIRIGVVVYMHGYYPTKYIILISWQTYIESQESWKKATRIYLQLTYSAPVERVHSSFIFVQYLASSTS